MIRKIKLDGSVTLHVDYEHYQRPLLPAKVKAIAENWDNNLCRVIVVTKRSDGTFWIIDGNHTYRAAILAGVKEIVINEITCDSIAEEARMFVLLNRGMVDGARSNVTPIQPTCRFKAQVTAGDQFSVATRDILAKHGYRIGHSAPWSFCSVTPFNPGTNHCMSLEAIDTVFGALAKCRNDEGPSGGLVFALATCEIAGLFAVAGFVERLAGFPISILNNAAKQSRQRYGRGPAKEVLKVVNYRCRIRFELPKAKESDK